MIAAVLSAGTPAIGGGKITVPAFFHYKDCGNGSINPDWDAIEAAGSLVEYVVVDMTTLCGAYVADNKVGFDKLRAKGIKVLGYVTTNHGTRLQTYVLNGGDITPPSNPYSVSDWYTTYGGYIDGIFFDEGPDNSANDSALQTYYANLHTAMKSINYSGGCYSGPKSRWEACVFLNATQYPNGWVTSVADEAIFWERALNGNQPYLTQFCPDNAGSDNCAEPQKLSGVNNTWMFTNAGSEGAHIIWSAAATDVEDIVCKSRERGSPDLYIHDDTSSDYGHLSTAFQELVDFQRGDQFCVDPATVYCGANTNSLDPCGDPVAGCQLGTWCPNREVCSDLGGYVACM